MRAVEDENGAGPARMLLWSEHVGRRRELHGWATGQRRAVVQALAGLHQAWSVDWGVLQDCHPAEEAPASVGSAPHAGATAEDAISLAYKQHFGVSAPVVIAAHGDGVTASLVHDISELAADDWYSRLAVLCGLRPHESPAIRTHGRSMDESRKKTDCWSGRVTVAFTGGAAKWSVTLDADQVRAVLQTTGTSALQKPSSPPMPLSSIQTAAAQLPMRVRAELREVVLSIEQLQALEPGDLIPLRHSLEEPVSLVLVESHGGFPTSESALHLCQAWLGQSDGRVAIQLAGATP